MTAGGQGIGRGISLSLAAAGANIVIAQRDMKKTTSTLTEIENLGRDAIAVNMDVAGPTSIESGISKALEHFGKIDILVNNAGAGEALDRPSTAQDFDLCYQVNLRGLWSTINELTPHFKARKAGKIINISSVVGRQANGLMPAYSASKAAVINLTQSLAMSLGPYNINVNTICPGGVKTAMLKKALKELGGEVTAMEALKKTAALKRIATTDDIGSAAVFFASEESRNITGQALNIDGGCVMN